MKNERDISLSKNTISSIMKRLHIASSYQRKKFRKPYIKEFINITTFRQHILMKVSEKNFL